MPSAHRDPDSRTDPRPADPESPSGFARVSKDYGRLAGLGMQFALSIFVLTYGGYWIDQRAGTLPLFLIVGLLLGFLGGTISIVRKVSPSRRPSD